MDGVPKKRDLKEWSKNYYQKHKDEIKQKRKQYYSNNKDKVIERITNYQKQHKKQRQLIEYKRNQRRRAPYHTILDNAGIIRICELCGSTEDLCVHHKDLNHNNNELSNLQWLCRSCHSKLHNEVKRNEKHQMFV